MCLSTALCKCVSDGSVAFVSPPACYVCFLPEEGRLSLGCGAGSRSGSNAGTLPPGSGFPCWREAPLRAEKVKTLLPSPEDGEVCRTEELLLARQRLGHCSRLGAAAGLRRSGAAAASPRPAAPFEGLEGASLTPRSFESPPEADGF